MSVKNGGDEDRPSILNEESESRIDSPTVDDRPFFVAAKKRKKDKLGLRMVFNSLIMGISWFFM